MTGAQAREGLVAGTLSLCTRIGRRLEEVRAEHGDAVAAVAGELGGRLLHTGKVVDVARRTTTGFARGSAVVAGASGDLVLEFQNEHLVARRDGVVQVEHPRPDHRARHGLRRARDHRGAALRPPRVASWPRPRTSAGTPPAASRWSARATSATTPTRSGSTGQVRRELDARSERPPRPRPRRRAAGHGRWGRPAHRQADGRGGDARARPGHRARSRRGRRRRLRRAHGDDGRADRDGGEDPARRRGGDGAAHAGGATSPAPPTPRCPSSAAGSTR